VFQRVLFLHEEHMNLQSLQHKALESDINLLKRGEISQVSCPDTLILYHISATQI